MIFSASLATRATSCAGVNAPSEAVVWVWRSMSFTFFPSSSASESHQCSFGQQFEIPERDLAHRLAVSHSTRSAISATV